uniref:Methyltransferase n=1 Tax=viral metagenome TaxID=1070528 RepID=A0A6C0H5J0_9ZZZZ
MTDYQNELINHIILSFTNAQKHISKLNEEILSMDGMSGVLTRHFYNNLLDKSNVNYLEIGPWKGSTLCSAMFGNNANIIAIDNFSEFENTKNELLENIEKYKGDNTVLFIEQDCFTVDISSFPKINIFLYDGSYNQSDVYNSLFYFYNALDDIFIYIVDDWNWEQVRNGTNDAIKNLDLEIIFDKSIRLTWDNSHTSNLLAKKSWWNGIYFAILKKK